MAKGLLLQRRPVIFESRLRHLRHGRPGLLRARGRSLAGGQRHAGETVGHGRTQRDSDPGPVPAAAELRRGLGITGQGTGEQDTGSAVREVPTAAARHDPAGPQRARRDPASSPRPHPRQYDLWGHGPAAGRDLPDGGIRGNRPRRVALSRRRRCPVVAAGHGHSRRLPARSDSRREAG